MSENTSIIHDYSSKEERLNIISHVLGFGLSIVAIVLLVVRAFQRGELSHIISFAVFGLSLAILYAASSLYHASKDPIQRKQLKVFDHAAIYALIAGTYTPFALTVIQGKTGWIIFGASWGFALVGITLKLFFTGRFKIISTLMYVLMGWMVVFVINHIIENLPSLGFYWLLAGGVAYTIGAVLYSLKRIPFNHAIFHVFVLIGSFCHFISVFSYILPA